MTNDKLAHAAHLLIAHLPPGDLGATKLNKILWFADCEFQFRHGRSLTGETNYVRMPQGPCPARITEVLDALKSSGAIVERLQPAFSYARREFTPVTRPDVSVFTAEEIEILLGTAMRLAPMTAKAVSRLSHDDLWEATEPDGLMSVESGSVRSMPCPPAMRAWAESAFAAE